MLRPGCFRPCSQPAELTPLICRLRGMLILSAAICYETRRSTWRRAARSVSHSLPPPQVRSSSHNRYPNHANHHIESFRLPAIIFEAPHPILLVIPERPCSRMHAPPPYCIICQGFSLHLLASFWRRRIRLRSSGTGIDGSGRSSVLDYGAGDGEFVSWRSVVRSGF